MKKLKIIIEHSYGQNRYYPNCEDSKLLAKFRNRISFTDEHLAILKKLGYELEDTTPAKEKVKL